MIAATRLDITPEDVIQMARAHPELMEHQEIDDDRLRGIINAYRAAQRMAAPLGDFLGTPVTPENLDRIRQMARELGIEGLNRDIAQLEGNTRGGGQWIRIEERNLVLIFRDEWREEMRDQVVEYFRHNRWSRNRSQRVTITLYGLNQERGSHVIACSYQGRQYPSGIDGHTRFFNDVVTFLPDIDFIQMNYTNTESNSIDIGCCRGFRTGDLLATDWEQYLRVINRTANYVTSLITRERAQGRLEQEELRQLSGQPTPLSGDGEPDYPSYDPDLEPYDHDDFEPDDDDD